MRRLITAACLCAAACRSEPPKHVAAQAAVSFALLDSEFQNASVPRDDQLLGVTWVESTRARTQHFMSGASGPDEVAVDESGFGSRDSTGFRWTLSFFLDPAGHLAVSQVMSDQWPQTSPIPRAAGGSVRFPQPVDADEAVEIECRLRDADHLVCIDPDHIGDGMEFRKHAPIPPRKRHFGLSDACAGTGIVERCAGVTARDIFTRAKLCYYTAYSLSYLHREFRPHEAWLAIEPDSLGAIFENGQRFLIQWRPFEKGIQYVVAARDRDVYGQITYDSSGFTGSGFDANEHVEWGMDGRRVACPSPDSLGG